MVELKPRTRERVEEENRLFGTLLVLSGITTVGVPALMVGRQTLTWLRDGYWPRLTIGDVLASNYPYTTWAGVQMILDWLLSWPASFGVFLVLGFLAYLISIPTGRVQAEMMAFYSQDRYRNSLTENRKDI